MSNSEVLQEYLIKLGYKTDLLSLRRFEDTLGGTTKSLLRTSSAVTGVVLATGAATAAFAYNMRRMYFASELSNSSVKNLKGVEFASKQIGVANGAMEDSIHSLAQSIRTQPGMEQFINSLGVPTNGRDVSDVALDLVSALSKMPEWQGVQFAQMFGMDPDTYHMLITHLDEFKERQTAAKKVYDDMGVSFEEHEKVVKQYAGTLDLLEEKGEALATTLLQRLLPTFNNISKAIDSGTDSLNKWLKTADTSLIENITDEGMWKKWWDITTGKAETTDRPKDAIKYLKKEHPEGSKTVEEASSTATAFLSEKGSDISSTVMDFFVKKGWAEEHAAGITASLQAESGFDPKAVGDKGKAVGIAQWHPDRQKAFKEWAGKDLKNASLPEQLEFVNYELVSGNEKRAGAKLRKAKTREESARAVTEFYERPADTVGAGNYRAGLAKAYKSSAAVGTQTAATKDIVSNTPLTGGLSRPEATMDLLNNTKLAGGLSQSPVVNQTTTFNITGQNADSIGKAVADKQTNVNRDIVRNLRGGVR